MDPNDKRHKEHNKRLLEEVKNGYNCAPLPIENYFYPPRPIIKKDKEALEFLHKKKVLYLLD